MMRQELLQTVIKEEEKLKRDMSFQNIELQYLENFLKNNKVHKLTDLKDIDVIHLIIACCGSKNPAFTIQELQNTFLALAPVVERKSPESFDKFFENLHKIYLANNFETIKLVLEEKNNVIKRIGLKSLLGKASVTKTKENMQLLDNKEMNILSYFMLLNKDFATIEEAVSMAAAIKEIQEIIKNASFLSFSTDEVKEIEAGTKEQQDALNEMYGIKPILDRIDVIRKRVTKLKSNENKRRRDASKGISEYENLRSLLQQEPELPILNHQEIVSHIPNEKIKLEVLKYIYTSNLPYYKNLEETYHDLTENSATKYQTLLSDTGISIEMCDMGRVMQNSLSDVKDMLKIITSFDIKDKIEIANILQSSTKAYLDSMVSFCKEGYFDLEFITSHPMILENPSFYDAISLNQKSMNEKGLNPLLLSRNPEAWFQDSNVLRENLDIIERYQFLSSMSRASKYSFLGSEELEHTIDTILELGYEELLEQNIDLLNYDSKKWMRIYILKELNMVPSDIDTLTTVLQQEQFFVPEEKMNDYISNDPCNIESMENDDVATEEEVRRKLDTFPQTKRTYVVGGVILSKNRVEKNIEEVGALELSLSNKVYLSLASNTILSESEHDVMQKMIQGSVKNKV